MALQIWLPLNGDLHNQGLSGDLTIINSGATINNNGKIGKCYSFDGSNNYIALNSSKLYDIFKGGSQAFSVAMWIYHADTTRAVIFGDYGLPGSISFNIELSEAHRIRFYWAGSPDKTFATTTAVEAAQWTHIVLTYNSSELLIYKNGLLQSDKWSGILTTKNKTTGNFYLGRDSRTGNTAFNGQLNDFRIYDHVLSPKEVEEIAKGLVLHYKLDNNGMGNKNYYTGNGIGSLSNTSSVSNSGYMSHFVLSGGGGVRVSNLGFDGKTGPWTTSFDIKSSVATTIGIDICDRGYNTATYGTNLPANTWVHKSFVVTAATNQYNVSGNYNGFIDFNIGSAGTYDIRNLKVEEGTKETAWSPAPSHTSYPVNYKTTIFDSSGYSNNGTISGTLTAAAPSPRYDVATQFTATNYIKNPDFIYNDSAWSISLWYFFASTPSGYQSLICLSKGNGSDANKKMAIIPNTSYIWFKCESNNGQLSSVKVNEWTHLVLTSVGKVYENGVEKLSITPGTVLTGCDDLVIGARASAANAASVTVPLTGKISDIRIYATALTATQVAELYNTSMSVDSNGNVYARELVEL